MRYETELVTGAVSEIHDAPPSGEQVSSVTSDQLRLEAFRNESDPLFFKEQRGEVAAGTWSAKVAEIRARYPDQP